MADGTFYFEDKFKEYQVTYMIRDMGYHFKKYAVKQKMGQETPTVSLFIYFECNSSKSIIIVRGVKKIFYRFFTRLELAK